VEEALNGRFIINNEYSRQIVFLWHIDVLRDSGFSDVPP
jgi:hypothetical protein